MPAEDVDGAQNELKRAPNYSPFALRMESVGFCHSEGDHAKNVAPQQTASLHRSPVDIALTPWQADKAAEGFAEKGRERC
jgi:hypothetical protein